MADLAAALVATEAGVGGGTQENDARAWSRYTKYCDSIGLDGNYFLDGMPQQHRIAIMGAFAVAMCEGRFLTPGDGPLAKKSVKGTVNAVAATFQENGREDPHRDAERHVGQLLQRQLRSYTKDDPKETQQKALPVCIYRIILSSPATELCRAIGKLAVAAHFLAMQSCKYSKVSRAEQRQTKQLCLCPVKIWTLIIRRILSYKGANKNSPVSLVKHKSKIINVTGEMIADLCRDGVVTIGETKLGIH
jgi:hypothetical protein